MVRLSTLVMLAALTALGRSCGSARADEPYAATGTLGDHRFAPAQLHAPAGKLISVTGINTDPRSEAF